LSRAINLAKDWLLILGDVPEVRGDIAEVTGRCEAQRNPCPVN
jgi:hypothetical protein